jgi:hypothetical protein
MGLHLDTFAQLLTVAVITCFVIHFVSRSCCLDYEHLGISQSVALNILIRGLRHDRSS